MSAHSRPMARLYATGRAQSGPLLECCFRISIVICGSPVRKTHQEASVPSRKIGRHATIVLEAAGEGTKMADHCSPIFRPRLSLFGDHLRTVLAVRVRVAALNNGAPLTGSGP